MIRRACFVVTAIVVACTFSQVADAQLASRPAAEWTKTLESPERIASLRTGEVIAKLNLKPGDVVADLGAGTGLFSLPLAKAVMSGRVYAVELDEGLSHADTRQGEDRECDQHRARPGQVHRSRSAGA